MANWVRAFERAGFAALGAERPREGSATRAFTVVFRKVGGGAPAPYAGAAPWAAALRLRERPAPEEVAAAFRQGEPSCLQIL